MKNAVILYSKVMETSEKPEIDTIAGLKNRVFVTLHVNLFCKKINLLQVFLLLRAFFSEKVSDEG